MFTPLPELLYPQESTALVVCSNVQRASHDLLFRVEPLHFLAVSTAFDVNDPPPVYRLAL